MPNFVITNVYSTPMTDDKYDGVAVVSEDPCKLLKLIVENGSSSIRWLQVHDGYEAPTAGDVPVVSIKLAASTQTTLSLEDVGGLPLSVGCVLTVSSTGPAYTAVTASSSDGAFINAFWI